MRILKNFLLIGIICGSPFIIFATMVNDKVVNVMTFNLRVCIDSGNKSCDARKINVENIINANINEGLFNPSIGNLDFVGFQESDLVWRNLYFNGKTLNCQFYKNISHISGCVNFDEGLALAYDTSRWEIVSATRKTLALDDDCKWSSNRDQVCITGNRMIGMAYFREKDTNQFIYIINTHGPRAVKWQRWDEFKNLFDERVNKDAPIIVLGDFNRVDPLIKYNEFIKVKTDPAGSHNFSNYWYQSMIDYIYYTKGLSILSQKVIHYPSQWSNDTSHGFASDHFPIWGSFKFDLSLSDQNTCYAATPLSTKINQAKNNLVLIRWQPAKQDENSQIAHYQILNWQHKPINKNGDIFKRLPNETLEFIESPTNSEQYHYYIRTICQNGQSKDSDLIIADAYDPSSEPIQACLAPESVTNVSMDANRRVHFNWSDVTNPQKLGYVIYNYNLQHVWSNQDNKWANANNQDVLSVLLTNEEFTELNVGKDNLNYKGPFVYYVGTVCQYESSPKVKENLLKISVNINVNDNITTILPAFNITKGYWKNNTSHRYTLVIPNQNDDINLHSKPVSKGLANSLMIIDEDSVNLDGDKKTCKVIDLQEGKMQGDCLGVVISKIDDDKYQIYLQPKLY